MLILVLCLDRQTRKVFTSFYKDSISIYIYSVCGRLRNTAKVTNIFSVSCKMTLRLIKAAPFTRYY